MMIMNRNELRLDKKYKLFINGKWQDSSSGETFKSYCPADGEFLAEIAQSSKEDVDLAVKSGKEAFKSWKKTSAKDRARILNKIADLIDENKEFLAMVETVDNGKPIRETLSLDIPLAAQHFRYFAGAILSDEGSLNKMDENTISLVIREPLGLVGQIIPWNFPFLMAAWKLAPVLAAGDCTVIKPSSSTSLSLLELMKLIGDIVPAGVINLITGSGSRSGQYILDHPGFDKLAFTGSTDVGYNVARAAADKLIPATLELGGKSANIFFDDCDMDIALEGALTGILFNQGQVCCAGSRIFVQESFYDEFIEKLREKFKNVKVGLPWLADTQLGAQINEGQRKKVMSYIKIGLEEGATLCTGGEAPQDSLLKNGSYTLPTLLTNVTNDMRVAREEIFGPVAVVIKFKDEDDLIKMANDSEYGLGGGVFTKNINRALRVAEALETGRVWVNHYNSIPEGAPFGGYKKSGIGRETHKMILDAYSQVKNIIINISDKPTGLY